MTNLVYQTLVIVFKNYRYYQCSFVPVKNPVALLLFAYPFLYLKGQMNNIICQTGNTSYNEFAIKF